MTPLFFLCDIDVSILESVNYCNNVVDYYCQELYVPNVLSSTVISTEYKSPI